MSAALEHLAPIGALLTALTDRIERLADAVGGLR